MMAWRSGFLFMILAVSLLFSPGHATEELTENEKLEAFWPAFAYFDSDRNARISAAEISYALNNGDALEDEEMREMIRAFGDADLNGDIQINFEEFASMMMATSRSEL
uniref:EF-hand domain-containing protein n=1 Tax=Octactis speculum TaxID=3111310 RepID=A0A6U3ZCH8_9STRA|mmetsp:Transcript_64950/g.89203  ORF Transcript_64950/g.89203 Transcript_64950/m.89203 type:complete len:108 (+) Transcript_64950:28-351(+)